MAGFQSETSFSLGGFGSGFGMGILPVAVIVARIMRSCTIQARSYGTCRSWHAYGHADDEPELTRDRVRLPGPPAFAIGFT